MTWALQLLMSKINQLFFLIDRVRVSINETNFFFARLDTQFDRDTQATFEKAKKINEELKNQSSDDKIYRGINNYQQFYEQRDTAQGKVFFDFDFCMISIFIYDINKNEKIFRI